MDNRVGPQATRPVFRADFHRGDEARPLLVRRGMRLQRILWACVLAVVPCATAAAQTSPARPSSEITVSASARVRLYDWDWFGGGDGEYAYPGTIVRAGVSQSTATHDWQVELALPLMFDLPSTAVAPPPQGQLGLGGSYFAANGNSRNNAALFIKQAYYRWKSLGGRPGQMLQVGRMEFTDGTETMPANAALAALKRDRIAQRLLGTFGFTDVGRSIDGAQYAVTIDKTTNVTALAGRPTQGVFQANGWRELDINVFYGAVTHQIGGATHPGEWRAFALAYDDYRDNVVKTDNRPAAVRAADTGSTRVETYGGHYLQLIPTPRGPVDLLAWGALQAGRWGALAQRAGAYALEAGWQPSGADRLKPWIRAGIDFGSGDGNAADGTHGTFFQVLTTPRVYARLPFYNLMNDRDAFGELIVHPTRKLTVRSDVHALSLASASDLWYVGGGAFQPQTFGYVGRPSGGHSDLATLADISGDYALSPHVAVGGYYGHAAGGAVPRAIYPASAGANLAYAELFVHF